MNAFLRSTILLLFRGSRVGLVKGAAVPALWSLLTCTAAAAANDFETANKLYFEGKFSESAAAYEQMIQRGQSSVAVYFNLGNAWFKAGQLGRALAAYHQARLLDPRDPAVRFNQKFVRQKVTGSDAPSSSAWQRALTSLTLNEWALASAGFFWLSFLLAAGAELRPALRRPLRNYTALAGVITALLVVCTIAAWRQARVARAVVAVPEAVVRHGPLERAAVAFQLRDGSEVAILDRQEIADGAARQTWLQVQDAGKRTGWLKHEQVIALHGR